MARYTGPRHKACRRARTPLCQSKKCPVERRPYPPGEHGRGRIRESDYLIQLRPSGIRVKLPNSIPALVTISTQVPIVGWEKRHLSPRECAGLQNLQSLKHLPKSDPVAYRAIGNAVNARIIELIGRALFGRSGIAKRQNYRRAS